MAHATARGAYAALADRLNRMPQGAPPTDLLFRILALLVTEREAGLVARLPVRPVTARRAARTWGIREAEARAVLDGLASRAILLDIEGPDGTLYLLPPPMAGFFEFSMMRVRDDLDQHLLAELFWQYITEEDDFILALFANGETQLGRAFVNEPALAEARPRGASRRRDDGPGRASREGAGSRPPARSWPVGEASEAAGTRSAVAGTGSATAGDGVAGAAGAAGDPGVAAAGPAPAPGGEGSLHVLGYERATEVIESARHIGIGRCYCRHKAEHLGRACAAPQGICMTFGGTADSLIRHGHARRVDAAEGRDLLAEAWEHRLVQFGENVQRDVAFICNCCGCCCEAMIAQRRFGSMRPVHTTNFVPHLDEAACTGCAKCVDACPVGAMTLVSANDPARPKHRRAELAADICLGCGVCTRVCNKGAVWLEPRAARVVTPVDTLHRTVLMAIERGKLQDCIFDNRALVSHRAMAAILGVILRLPPTKQVLANRQVKSRYLAKLLERVSV